jgi:cytoskeletal protein RodZ
MTTARRLPITAFVLLASGPLAWLACGGGESKPPETPATESSASASSEEPAGSSAPATAASASSAAASDTSAAPASTSEPTKEAPPPPSPSLGSTDCGKCIDKTCSKQEASCGKNTDCQATLDSIHGCSKGAAECIGETPPSAAKPKKLAAAYEACAKKAIAKACKAKCK